MSHFPLQKVEKEKAMPWGESAKASLMFWNCLLDLPHTIFMLLIFHQPLSYCIKSPINVLLFIV
ncbi:MAG: hypothetical protein AYK19_09045 [Theionarchaea archaeon DG-70-1]|nr:MAG: hypothetical protein AYK19_09045 [Theionarchaea archaeon DG-70-1]